VYRLDLVAQQLVNASDPHSGRNTAFGGGQSELRYSRWCPSVKKKHGIKRRTITHAHHAFASVTRITLASVTRITLCIGNAHHAFASASRFLCR
jgi:hypothetical protein